MRRITQSAYRGRASMLALALTTGLAGSPMVLAQAGRQAAKAGAATAPQAKAQETEAAPSSRLVRIPTNPNDSVATVNGEAITRQQLSDECIARKGEEILETLVNRKLIDQMMRAKKIEVTAAEVDAEIERVAQTVAGVSKEQWLRSLAKERNISPAQYSRDIIYPAMALRKLAAPRVQITDQDIKDALESQYGDKLVYRMIMSNSVDHAKLLWEDLKKNPGRFENLARTSPYSVDPATRAEGGKPTNGPLARHSYPREVSDRVFAQLVDGDPDDKNPEHKPKDGDISGPIQVTDQMWVVVKREAVLPSKPYDASNPAIDKQIRESIFESKIQQHMEELFSEMSRTAAIENKLTGSVKTADNELKPPVDGEVKLMGQKADAERAAKTGTPTVQPSVSTAASTAAASKGKVAPPRNLDPADLETRERAKVDPQAK